MPALLTLALFLLLSPIIYIISSFQSQTQTPLQSQPPTTYIYKTVQNLSIQADVFLPNTNVLTLCSLFMEVATLGVLELEEMLYRGWAAVSIDYCLAPAAFLLLR